MTMVLKPILKSPLPEKMKPSGSSHVTFDVPDEENIIDCLKNEGMSMKLNILIRRIADPSTEDNLLLNWIQDFKDNILFPENSEVHARIVRAFLNLKWYAKDDLFVKVYQDFILNIVTAHPTFLKPVLIMILQLFHTAQDLSNDKVTDIENCCFQNGHILLENIIKLVPISENLLSSLLAEKFPYIKSPSKKLLCYVQNLLHLCSYLRSKRSNVLLCIAEKFIQIGVVCSRKDIEMSEMKLEDVGNMIIDPDLMDDSTVEKMANPLAHSMDIILDTIYRYIQEICFPSGADKCDWEATKKLYKELLTVFDKVVLPTHESCHIQYLMFYICSFKSDLAEGFLDYLWKKVQNPSVGPVYRQLSSFYIGSFLTRAKFINFSTVTACLSLMCEWIHSYIDNHTSQDLDVHGTFHSVCQTVFYVFAFRSQEFLEADKGLKFLKALNFDRIVTCRLNPLRYCDKSIVQNFANIARNFQIAYVYPVIEKNNRNLLYSSDGRSSCNNSSMIQTFFPFDPYILKRSKTWIEPIYRVYSHCQKEEEFMDTVDEDATNICESIFTYSSSPGFKKSFLFKR